MLVTPVSPIASMREMADSIVSNSSSKKANTNLIQEQSDSIDLFPLLLPRFRILLRVDVRVSKKVFMSPSLS